LRAARELGRLFIGVEADTVTFERCIEDLEIEEEGEEEA
jgi:hypothetical protein